jgi:hypothetical protein
MEYSLYAILIAIKQREMTAAAFGLWVGLCDVVSMGQ